MFDVWARLSFSGSKTQAASFYLESESVRVSLLRLPSARQGAVITVTIECHCALDLGNEVSEAGSCLE